MRTVECSNNSCVNFASPIVLSTDDGTAVICGPCGAVLAEQAEWYVPPEPDEPEPSPVDAAASALAALTPEERAALIDLLTPPQEGD